ncbi:MAG: LuxR C-terminal-related transcriptional regulator [Thermoleophilia bacterium]
MDEGADSARARTALTMVADLDDRGAIVSVTENVETLLGFAPAEVLGKTPFEAPFAVAEEVNGWRRAYDDKRELGVPVAVYRTRVRCRAGHVVPVEVVSMPIAEGERRTRVASRVLAPHLDELPLTGRQIEILRLLAATRSTREIANALYLSEATVRNHVGAILQRLGARTRLEAVVEGMRLGLL